MKINFKSFEQVNGAVFQHLKSNWAIVLFTEFWEGETFILYKIYACNVQFKHVEKVPTCYLNESRYNLFLIIRLAILTTYI